MLYSIRTIEPKKTTSSKAEDKNRNTQSHSTSNRHKYRKHIYRLPIERIPNPTDMGWYYTAQKKKSRGNRAWIMEQKTTMGTPGRTAEAKSPAIVMRTATMSRNVSKNSKSNGYSKSQIYNDCQYINSRSNGHWTTNRVGKKTRIQELSKQRMNIN